MCRTELFTSTAIVAPSPGARWQQLRLAQAHGKGGGSAEPGLVSLCSVRALPGNGEGGDSVMDCTAAHCSTPGTKACWENATRVAAVC